MVAVVREKNKWVVGVKKVLGGFETAIYVHQRPENHASGIRCCNEGGAVEAEGEGGRRGCVRANQEGQA